MAEFCITVFEAVGLANTELIGKQDPYIEIRTNKEKKYTSTDNNGGKNPVWKEEKTMKAKAPYGLVEFFIYNKNVLKDTLIGLASMSLDTVVASGFVETNLPVITNGKQQGYLHVAIRCKSAPPQPVPGYPQPAPVYPPQPAPVYPPQPAPAYPPEAIPVYPTPQPAPAYPPQPTTDYPPQPTPQYPPQPAPQYPPQPAPQYPPQPAPAYPPQPAPAYPPQPAPQYPPQPIPGYPPQPVPGYPPQPVPGYPPQPGYGMAPQPGMPMPYSKRCKKCGRMVTIFPGMNRVHCACGKKVKAKKMKFKHGKWASSSSSSSSD